MKPWLQDTDMEMYSIHNKGNPDAAETFIRTFIKFIITFTFTNI